MNRNLIGSIGSFIFSICFSLLLSKNSVRKNELKRDPIEDALEDSCSACSSTMTGTVKHYDKHVIVYDANESWGKKVESEEGSLVNMLNEAISENKTGPSIKLTVCFYPEMCTPDEARVLIYPEAQVLTFPKSVINVNRVASYLRSGDQNALNAVPNYSISIAPWKRLALVCVHQARDKRCGRAGPQVINSMKEYLASQNIASNELMILPSSHIGGHEFAGTLITYPSGNWYGRITKANTMKLLDCVLKDIVYSDGWRGCPSW
jgi:hypothetical protein